MAFKEIQVSYFISLPETGFSKYKLLMEPLHDVLNRIKNLGTELPHHFDKKQKK